MAEGASAVTGLVAAVAARRARVAVRELCEFTAKSGDLDLRFTPSPTAAEGMAGHATVSSRRPAGFQREMPLEGEHQGLTIRGRADGFDPAKVELEEVKTCRGRFENVRDNHRALHWAQLRIYGALLAQSRALARVDLRLTYFDIETGNELSLRESWSAEKLAEYLEEHGERYRVWHLAQETHRSQLQGRLATLRFPFANFNAGQRRLAEAAYRGAVRGQALMIEAPTGIGKTVGTLFPVLKACARGDLDKVFFLTAKTSGRQLALGALRAICGEHADALPLRVLELVAREKACVYPDKRCQGESCPLARGFYDRLAAAREDALQQQWLDAARVQAVAQAHEVCPYYLSQDLARWCDVIVGDYHYYFDRGGLLHELAALNDWRVSVLVDEAHNLVDRGRAMFSAELDQQKFAHVRSQASGTVKTRLDRVNRRWNELNREPGSASYRIRPDLPERFIESLNEALAAISAQLNESPDQIEPDLQRFFFDAGHFIRIAESFGDHSLFDITRSDVNGRRPATVLCLRNVIPAPFLAPRFAAASSSLVFSATLSPAQYYCDMLGLPSDTATIEVPSPFDAGQLSVHCVDHVSTRFSHRSRSLAPIARLIRRQFEQQPGNYLAFFSSFQYLEQAALALQELAPGIPQWRQTARMSEAHRSEFLNRFTLASQGVGFAVLGGAFAEGIDLPGARLIGAFVATLGLPQFNPVNEAFRDRMEALFGQGYEYAYLYPGLRKVIQAAGRVIRGCDDRGVLMLIDDRYRSVQHLLPGWWNIAAMPRELASD